MLHNVVCIVELIDLTLLEEKIDSSCLNKKIVYVLEISKGKQGCGHLNPICCKLQHTIRFRV